MIGDYDKVMKMVVPKEWEELVSNLVPLSFCIFLNILLGLHAQV